MLPVVPGDAFMEFLQMSHFASHVNETFATDIDGHSAVFILLEVLPMQAHAFAGKVREPFALLFRNEAAVVFPQRIYTMRNEAMGELGIFLVPVARDREGFLYQAVFN